MPTPKTFRTGRGARTRRRVLDVTRRLLCASDPGKVTLDQISEAASVAKSSILWHFGSKEELFLEALDGVIRDFEQTFSARHPEGLGPTERLRLFFRDYAAFLKAYPHLISVFFAFVFSHKPGTSVHHRAKDLYRRYRTMVADDLSDVVGPSRQNLAAGIVGLVDGVCIQWYVEPEALDPGTVFEAILSAFASLETAPGAGTLAGDRRGGKEQVP